MQLQPTILALLTLATTPLHAMPLTPESTSLQPHPIQSETCHRVNFSIAAIQEYTSSDCDAQCRVEANNALEILDALWERFSCGS